MKSYAPLLVFLGLSFAAAAIGAAFPPGAWYAGLDKPSWNPPNWLFGPVWTVLYIMIAVAGWQLWQHRETSRLALIAWSVQLVLNAMWSWLFFGLHRMDLAFVEIVVLWVAIVATIGLGWRQSRWASGLLMPYLVWVSFAAFLNWTVWQMNA